MAIQAGGEDGHMNRWYERSFGEDYLLVYKHRDFTGAHREVKAMIDWLSLPAGSRVLDLCCGMGRHSLALTEFGYQVTGVDLSEVLLSAARKSDPQKSVTWLRGDMRDVPLDTPFDAVVNLFTSFGYFDQDEENAKVLHEIDRLIKPGGRFIIDFLNPGRVRSTLVPYSERVDEGETIREYRRIEDGFVKKDIVIQGPVGGERRYSEQVRLYEKEDFVRMLDATKLRIDHIYGGYDGSAYDAEESLRLILVGTKA